MVRSIQLKNGSYCSMSRFSFVLFLKSFTYGTKLPPMGCYICMNKLFISNVF